MAALERPGTRARDFVTQYASSLDTLIEEEVQQRTHDLQTRLTSEEALVGARNATIKGLESEYALLRARLQAATTATTESRSTKPEAWRAKFELLEVDFKKVSRARDLLEARCRKYKDFHQRWHNFMEEAARSGPLVDEMWTQYLSSQPKSSEGSGASKQQNPGNITRERYLDRLNSLMDRNGSARSKSPVHLLQPTEHASQTQRNLSPNENLPTTFPVPHSSPENTRDVHGAGSGSSEADTATSSGQGFVPTPQGPSNSGNHTKDPAPHLPDQVESDSPVFLSARSLKRKRGPTSSDSSGRPEEQPSKVKEEETLSSSPTVPTLPRLFVDVHDSLDLDDVGLRLRTPRKQRNRRVSINGAEFGGSGGPGGHPYHGEQGIVFVKEDAEIDIEVQHDLATKNHAYDMAYGSPNENEVQQKSPSQQENATARKSVLLAEQRAYNERVLKRRMARLSSGGPQSPTVTNVGPSPLHNKDIAIQGRGEQEGFIQPLRQRDPNVLPRTSDTLSTAGPRRGSSAASNRRDPGGGAGYIDQVAEDGEHGTLSSTTKNKSAVEPPTDLERRTTTDQNTSRTAAMMGMRTPNVQRRLHSLMQNPTPERAPLSAPNRRTRTLPQQQIPSTVQALSRKHSGFKWVKKFSNTSTQTRPRTPAAQTTSSGGSLGTRPPRRSGDSFSKPNPYPLADGSDEAPEVLPEHEPLRARPLSTLRLTDFKLDPSHSEYAYQQSIRGHDEKKSLSGCTDPFCQRCKDIAHFAELSGFVSTPKPPGLFDSSPPLDKDAAAAGKSERDGEPKGDGEDAVADLDLTLIERALGRDAYADFALNALPNLSLEDRADMVRSARRALFVERFGAHRPSPHHPRSVTPPDFWNTDMPSTQQEAENRAAARAMERGRVKDRYFEALKGGLWKFADE